MKDNKKDNISWTSFCQAMNSIAFWLIKNKKKFKKRDYYQILTLKGSYKDIEKKAKKLGNDKLVAMYTMALIKDNKSLDFLPLCYIERWNSNRQGRVCGYGHKN